MTARPELCYIVPGEYARLAAPITIITKREPSEKANRKHRMRDGMQKAIRFAIRFQHCAVASAARVTPPAPLHPNSERMSLIRQGHWPASVLRFRARELSRVAGSHFVKPLLLNAVDFSACDFAQFPI